MKFLIFNKFKSIYNEQFADKIVPSLLFVRSFIYTFIIIIILFVLYKVEYTVYESFYKLTSSFLLIIFLIEGYFTYKYTVNHISSRKKHIFSDLLINHLCYPTFTLFSLIFYLIINRDFVHYIAIITIIFFLLLFYFYYLPFEFVYIYDKAKNYKKLYLKSETVTHIFKFFSYFVIHLTLWSYYFYNLLSKELLIMISVSLNFIYLLFYLYKKDFVSRFNMFMAFLFAVIIGFFILLVPFFGQSINAVLNVVYFYLASSIFYHKLEGNFSYKILLEYLAIAIIISIFIAYL